VTVYCTISPLRFNTKGPNTYYAVVTIRDKTKTDFSLVSVTVNAVDLSYIHESDNFSCLLQKIDSGDQITLSLSGDGFGTYRYSLKVPGTLEDFSMNPEMPEYGSINTASSYTMTWNPAEDNDTYSAVIWGYSDKECLNFIPGTGRGHTTQDATTVFNADELTNPSDNSIIPFFKIRLNTQETLQLREFSPSSYMYLYGPCEIVKMN